jgi:hypothetical protein
MFNVDRTGAHAGINEELNGCKGRFIPDKCPQVMQQLQEDFFNKCYLCEDRDITKIEVDHFIPKVANKGLNCEWGNLFFSCGHCNGIKHTDAEEILDCTNFEHKVYDWLKYNYDAFSESGHFIINVSGCYELPQVHNTAQLLNKIYNGHTVSRKLEANNLRKKVNDEIKKLKELLNMYTANSTMEVVIDNIKKVLSRKSAFSAFKRQIIKDKYKDLEKYFD